MDGESCRIKAWNYSLHHIHEKMKNEGTQVQMGIYSMIFFSKKIDVFKAS